MNESTVTLQGWVGSEVRERDANGVPVASFRLACTPRYLKEGTWTDGPTSWFTINAWRGLAHNVVESVHKGDAVFVEGRIRADTWQRDGLPDSTTLVVDARVLGHDLNRGVCSFVRPVRGTVTEEQAAEPTRGPEQPVQEVA
ncbi:single-stranded DNA-binding protein [Nocardioides mangrovicus]|uniref:Single-stranded DNA-binding protein n=1 Tax=Nocardioides mangrovicus TaxID=2478913 RepID=A0A3L8P337_9ACTN|nr:single-stranded DNA-binding protein [Nocardioides mangrovicus]RLV49750.1 single-stranded DNA-binding protein [Nocardioides mangrovicus]